LPLRPTVHRAVLPAAVPDSATDFFGFGKVETFSLIGVLLILTMAEPAI
jgi:hypothetical protein